MGAEFRKEIRDPYPSIGEKAVGKWGRMLCTVCICLTLYGAGCVFIVLISQLVQSLMEEIGVSGIDSLCLWMLIVTVFLTPLTWLGTPKDFWPIAVGALLTTVAACILIIIQALIDREYVYESKVDYGSPTIEGSIKAFASIMFAFAGASTFPTIQADMKHKDQFKISAIIACTILFLIYLPMAIAPYYGYGSMAKANIVMSLSKGWMRTTVEVMLLLHLVAAFPIILNPPAQYFEHIMNIPTAFNWKRCALRTVSVFVLLFIAETIPSFGSILDLVGASTVTMLTFVCPPYFYMRLCDSSKQNKEWTQRELPTWERVYCWVLIVVGFLGGAAATYISLQNIVSSNFQMPCYLQSGNVTIDASH